MAGSEIIEEQRKPRIALMGEFSAGKSTLSNLLLGARPLPESVTATCLSPVWISQGPRGAVRELLDGTTETVSMGDLHSVPIDNTRVIRLKFEADLLNDCDLIDCPGISDPNMPSEVWERLIPEIDAVIWCTHATQAWRQSEAAVWEGIPDEIKERSLLLITRFDKITNERDQLRVLARVKRETDGLFAGIYPIALLQALSAGDDEAAWERSGAHSFAERLMSVISELSALPPRETPRATRPAPAPAPDLDEFVEVTPERRASLFDMDATPTKPRRVTSRPALLDQPAAQAPEPDPTADPEISMDFAFLREPEDQPEVPLESLSADKQTSAPRQAMPRHEEPQSEEFAPASVERGTRIARPEPTAEVDDLPNMNPRTLTEAVSRSTSPRSASGVRPITLDKKRPVPTQFEDQPAPDAEPPLPHDAVSSSVVKPRRVSTAKGSRTERPTRKRPEKNPSMARNIEPSLTDLRSAFSQD